MKTKYLSAAEQKILEDAFLEGMTEDMREVAVCMYEALVLADERVGQYDLDDVWKTQLHVWSAQTMEQMRHITEEIGGRSIYFSKGWAVQINQRDRELYKKFTGRNLRELAKQYGLTETRVRQIIAAIRREEFLLRQQQLPGFE